MGAKSHVQAALERARGALVAADREHEHLKADAELYRQAFQEALAIAETAYSQKEALERVVAELESALRAMCDGASGGGGGSGGAAASGDGGSGGAAAIGDAPWHRDDNPPGLGGEGPPTWTWSHEAQAWQSS